MEKIDQPYERLLELNEQRESALHCSDVADAETVLGPELSPEALLADSDRRLPDAIRFRRDERVAQESRLQRATRAISRALNHAFDADVRRVR